MAKRMVSYYKYYHRYYRLKKKCEELESEIKRLKPLEELERAYKILLRMMLRYVFEPKSITPESLENYRKAFRTIDEKEKNESVRRLIIPWTSKVIEILEKRLKTKAPQK